MLRFRRGCLAVSLASAVFVACGERHVQPLDTTSVKSCGDELGSTAGSTDLYLATGSSTGTYVRLGAAITRYADTIAGRRVRACTTQGSLENMIWLRNNKNAAFALVQLDVLHEAAVNGLLRALGSDIRAVAYLYSEKLHVFVRSHRYLSSPGALGVIADKKDLNGISNW